MVCFQLYDYNRKCNPPNLFRKRCPDYGCGMEDAVSDGFRHSQATETEGYDPSCRCGSGTMELGKMPGIPGICYERKGDTGPVGPGGSRAHRAVPVNAWKPARRVQRSSGRPGADRASRLSPEQHICHVYGPGESYRSAPAFRLRQRFPIRQGTSRFAMAALWNWRPATMPSAIIYPS